MVDPPPADVWVPKTPTGIARARVSELKFFGLGLFQFAPYPSFAIEIQK